MSHDLHLITLLLAVHIAVQLWFICYGCRYEQFMCLIQQKLVLI